MYSNQPTVTLYLNGVQEERKTADKVFVFRVALKEGFNNITVEAGGMTDSMTLEKVEKEPSIYILPEVGEWAKGVANWFRLTGDLDLKAPMEYPEGKYSIKDTFGDLFRSSEAWEMVTQIVKLITGITEQQLRSKWEAVVNMTPEALIDRVGDMAPEGISESLNQKLNQIDKVVK